MSLRIPDSIVNMLASQRDLAGINRKLKWRKNAALHDPAKPTLTDLPDEILLNEVFPRLLAPDLICLALTSKDLAAKVLAVTPSVNDEPTIVKVQVHLPNERNSSHDESQHAFDPSGPIVHSQFSHISSRKQLLSQLRSYMPRGYRLCWICNRYTHHSKDSWLSLPYAKRVRAHGHHEELLSSLYPTDVQSPQRCCPFYGNIGPGIIVEKGERNRKLKRYMDSTPGAGYRNLGPADDSGVVVAQVKYGYRGKGATWIKERL